MSPPFRSRFFVSPFDAYAYIVSSVHELDAWPRPIACPSSCVSMFRKSIAFAAPSVDHEKLSESKTMSHSTSCRFCGGPPKMPQVYVTAITPASAIGPNSAPFRLSTPDVSAS